MSAPPARASDLVRDSQLSTTISTSLTHHSYYVSDPESRRRRTRIEETWQRGHELGNGTFGRVWLETCQAGLKSGQLRAIKEIPKNASQSSSIDYGRELEAMAKFSHQRYVHCFVQSFGWYESHHAVFIAMEYLAHGDLQKHLVVPFSESTTKEITVQIAEGLVFMHDNGFAHRDLKPANILVVRKEPEWWVKIGDFGISKRAEVGSALRTLVGTQGYLAPEVIGIFPISESHGGKHEQISYTASVDIWALGEIAVRMLTQRPAFADPRDLFNYVVHETQFPRHIFDGLDVHNDFYNFIERAMGPSPLKRLRANELASHPWLKASRPSSRASSHDSDIFVDASPVPFPFSPASNTHTADRETLASAQWSTLNQPEAPPRPTTSELALTPANISAISESSSFTMTTVSDISPVSLPTTLPETAPPDSAESEIVHSACPLAENSLNSSSCISIDIGDNTATSHRGSDDTAFATAIRLSKLDFDASLSRREHGNQEIKGSGTNQPDQRPKRDGFHQTPRASQANSQLQVPSAVPHTIAPIPQGKQEQIPTPLSERRDPKTVQADLSNLWQPETASGREGTRSVPPNMTGSIGFLAKNHIQRREPPRGNPQSLAHARSHSLPVTKTPNPDSSSTSKFQRLHNAATISDANLLAMRTVRTNIDDLVLVDPEEVTELVQICTLNLKARALENAFFLLPYRPISATSPPVREWIRHYFSESCPRGNKLRQQLRMEDPLTVAGILKWCWARIPGGVVGWDVYELFKVGEQDSNMPRDAFSTFIPICVESLARRSILFHFFDLLSATATHAKTNGLSGWKLSRMAGWWAFELDTRSRSFNEGYKSWLAAANATSHLFFAYLRAQIPTQSNIPIHTSPMVLRRLLDAYEYPPHFEPRMQNAASKALVTVDIPTPTTAGILRRAVAARQAFDNDQYQAFRGLSEETNLTRGLSDECSRVLQAITRNQKPGLGSISFLKRFEEIGFSQIDIPETDDLRHTESGFESLGPPKSITLDSVKLDDVFWWVWMQSLAPEETPVRQQIFWRTVMAETIFSGQWVICEEALSTGSVSIESQAKVKNTRRLSRFTRAFNAVGKA